jgi:hypothetical protein
MAQPIVTGEKEAVFILVKLKFANTGWSPKTF